jgi:hypothetical protein
MGDGVIRAGVSFRGGVTVWEVAIVFVPWMEGEEGEGNEDGVLENSGKVVVWGNVDRAVVSY